nr:hemagglutinin-neuraminidase [Avian orthoavulavirus 21]
MEHGLSAASLANDRAEAKNTWRAVFRIVSLLLTTACVAVSIAALVYSIGAATPEDLEFISPLFDSHNRDVTTALGTIADVDNKIYRQVALEHPVSLLNTESTIMSALTSLSYQINNAANASGCGAPIHDKDYIGGVAKEIYTWDEHNATKYYPSKFLEHLNFIPAPTTGNGCTRIPSFDASATHYCYTHNVILNGCKDYAHSYQYIALGVFKISPTGNVFLSTLRSINLDDNENRKSCSITATPLGCDLLCAKVTEREEDDYASPEPTQLVHGRMGFDGVYHEEALPVATLFRDWAANYPTVGGGGVFDNRVWFGIYGGVRQDTPTEESQRGKFAIYRRVNNTCPDGNTTQVTRARDAYRPTRFGRKLVQQAILSIPVGPELARAPKLSVLDNNVMLMGAEARVMVFGHQALLYQRGSSYFPSALLYPLTLTNGTASAGSPYIFDKFTRPGSPPCHAPARCPNSCVTGVYTDAYPLFWDRNHRVTGVYGMMLDDDTARLNPTAAVFDWTKRGPVMRVSNSNTKAAYSTSTCFRVVKTNRVYCLSIVEVGNTLFGEFRITPLLTEILPEAPSSSARSEVAIPREDTESTGWTDITIDSPFCDLINGTAAREEVEAYAASWP